MGLVLDVAGADVALVVEHFGKDGTQAACVLDGTAFGGVFVEAVESVVGDVEGGAEEVAGLFDGIAVAALESFDVGIGAQNAGDDEFVGGNVFGCQTVEEGVANFFEKNGCSGDEVGNGVGEVLYVVVGAGTDVNVAFGVGHGFFAVFALGLSDEGCCGDVDVLSVAEDVGVIEAVVDGVVHMLAVGCEEDEFFAGTAEIFVDSAAGIFDAVGYVFVGKRVVAVMMSDVLQGGVSEFLDVLFYLSGDAGEEASEDVEDKDDSPELEEEHGLAVAFLLAFMWLTTVGGHRWDFAG